MKRIALGLAGLLLAAGAQAQVPAFQTTAPFAYMMSADTGAVLYDKNGTETMAPSSMAKMMTTYVVFDMIRKGTAKLTDQITVSPETWRAWNNRGSTMFLSPNQSVSVEDLLHGVVTLSGNDACVVLGEGLAGTEQAFVDVMNQTARRLGMTGSHFTNTTGWPDEAQYVTARDMAILGYRTIRDFPDLYRDFYGLSSYSHGQTMGGKPIVQGNRNPLLYRVPGSDGLKTGHTEAGGYGLTGSTLRNGQRLIIVLNGLTSMQERADESAKFMEWGLRTFQTVKLFRKGAIVETAPVWLGAEKTVPLTVARDAAFTTSRVARSNMKVSVRYTGPIPAPIKAGQHVADLVVAAPGQQPLTIPLVAARGVEKAGVFGRIMAGFRNTLFGTPAIEAK